MGSGSSPHLILYLALQPAYGRIACIVFVKPNYAIARACQGRLTPEETAALTAELSPEPIVSYGAPTRPEGPFRLDLRIE